MYLAVLVTGGLFSLVWILLLMRDVNELEQKTIFPVKLYAQMTLFGVMIFFFAAILLGESFGKLEWWWLLLLGLTILLGIALDLFLFISLTRVSLHITKGLGYDHHAVHALVMILLVFVYFVSFILLQRRMNALIVFRARPGMTGRST